MSSSICLLILLGISLFALSPFAHWPVCQWKQFSTRTASTSASPLPPPELLRGLLFYQSSITWGSPCSSVGKESACRAGNPGSDPWVGKIPLEKEMATHSSILAWKISRTEEPGGLQSMGSKESGTTEWLTQHTAIVSMFHFGSSDLIHFTAESLCPLTTLSLSPVPTPPPDLHFSTLKMLTF